MEHNQKKGHTQLAAQTRCLQGKESEQRFIVSRD